MAKNLEEGLLADLQHRQLVADTTLDLKAGLEKEGSEPLTLYLGIDPTSASLHLGSLLGVIMLERFRRVGHRSLILVGGATGMIGDPSGRSNERNLLDEDTLEQNFQSIRSQIQSLTEIPGGDFLDNRQWLGEMGVLEFLRNVGKHASLNQMVARESVKTRMESGISFTEFSYMLLQAYDFFWLHENLGCSLQVGGSDQWGNITAGIDLIRRISGGKAHGLTWPLVEKADGTKFGKTADGTIWLDSEMTSPFDFYQYLYNLDDQTAGRLVFWLTFDSVGELDELVKAHSQKPEARQLQEHLALQVTSFVHSKEEAEAARNSSASVFSSDIPGAEEIEQLRGKIPETLVTEAELAGEEPLVDLLVKSGLCKSKGDARRQLKQNGISVNGEKTAAADLAGAEILGGKYLLLARGKRTRHLIVLEN